LQIINAVVSLSIFDRSTSQKIRRTSARAGGSPRSQEAQVETSGGDETQDMETDMRMIVLALSLVALATPSQAAPRARTDDATAREKMCRELVGKEQPEGEGRGNVGHFQAQRFSECMMGRSQ